MPTHIGYVCGVRVDYKFRILHVDAGIPLTWSRANSVDLLPSDPTTPTGHVMYSWPQFMCHLYALPRVCILCICHSGARPSAAHVGAPRDATRSASGVHTCRTHILHLMQLLKAVNVSNTWPRLCQQRTTSRAWHAGLTFGVFWPVQGTF